MTNKEKLYVLKHRLTAEWEYLSDHEISERMRLINRLERDIYAEEIDTIRSLKWNGISYHD